MTGDRDHAENSAERAEMSFSGKGLLGMHKALEEINL